MASRKPTVGGSTGVAGKRPDGPDARDDDDRQLFERELADVRPWQRGANRVSWADFEQESARPSRPQRSSPSKPTGSSRVDLQVEATPEGAVGIGFGVSKQTVAGLRRGRFGFDARCDLHKLRAEAARRKLTVFVDECIRRNLRAGLVICGRGLHSGPEGPVLARVVAEAFARPPISRHILAFAPAAPEQGGPGAIAVLFRRSEAEAD
jgi:DNA-nicking Smr family endonuclease